MRIIIMLVMLLVLFFKSFLGTGPAAGYRDDADTDVSSGIVSEEFIGDDTSEFGVGEELVIVIPEGMGSEGF